MGRLIAEGRERMGKKKLTSLTDLLEKHWQGPSAQGRAPKSGESALNAYGGGDFLQLIRQWDRVVGAKIAAHTAPLKLIRKTLVILVKHPQYAHHLSFLEADICQKIASIFPALKHQCEKISFKTSAAHFDQVKKWHAPITTAKPLAQKLEKKHGRFSPQYRQAQEQAQQSFAHLEDTELRQLLIDLEIERLLG